MFDDARIAAAFQAMLLAIPTPPLEAGEIRRRAARVERRDRRGLAGIVAGLAAAIAIVLALPAIAPGLTETIEARVAAILRWTPPPPVPSSVERHLTSKDGSLAEAQRRVRFTIVTPAGLPHDVVAETITTTPTAVFAKGAQTWSVGDPSVTFSYLRNNRATFTLLASRVDAREGPPSKYVFDADQRVHGLPVRHDQFTWRNGNQQMSAVAGEGLSAREIVAIRVAMHGIPVPGTWPPRSGSVDKQYRLR